MSLMDPAWNVSRQYLCNRIPLLLALGLGLSPLVACSDVSSPSATASAVEAKTPLDPASTQAAVAEPVATLTSASDAVPASATAAAAATPTSPSSVLVAAAAPATASSIDGRFAGQVDGLHTVLNLTTQSNAVVGTYAEGALELRVAGAMHDGVLTATVTEPRSGMQIAVINGPLRGDVLDLTVDAHNPLTGVRRSVQASFQREGARVATPAQTPKAVASGQHDPRLVGTWLHEKMINSGGSNFASFTTVLTMVVSADGTLAQYTQSVGGGSNWSYGDGRRELQYQGQWFTRDGVMHVKLSGAADFVPATRYRFAGAYLVTEDNNGRMNWKRP